MTTIVWDVDDVLNDLMRDWLTDAWQPAHPDCGLRYDELLENPPHGLLSVSREEYLASLDSFREREGKNLRPNPEVLAWFEKNGFRYNHAVLTAVPLKHAGISAEWVFRHFGRWIQSFNVVPSPRSDDPTGIRFRKKGDFLRWWGRAAVFVDDSPANIAGAEGLGLRCLSYPRPWNRWTGGLAEIESLSLA